MTEAKTQITAVTVDAFIEAVEPQAKRDDARVLDAMFRRVTGEAPKMWGPSIIGYGDYRTTYESGRDVHTMRTGFSPRKAKYSLYLMGGYCDDITAQGRDEKLERLGKYSTGKSCLYVNKLADIDLAVLEEIVAADWQTMLRLFPKD
ncbi:DUF1801 domain-containing protein [Porphyrobacter sp. SLTP]|uniref:DUF1801 domain-containing protein n=1 Tax=Porphyrobacter sp. SLTP TaxID=2683266 RepID=UPI001412DB7D|nr:DUF1801 domain-containing protein [Porphyrobacter sp. SLTP]NBB24954.1 DUF1801 domain-containing protein [Porphyrobacter sp. SLTP]